MQLDFRKKHIYAIKPLPSGPAAQAGILHGDDLIQIDGKLLASLSQEEVISHIRGPRGTQVKFLLQRKGENEPRLIVVTRERIQIQEPPQSPSTPIAVPKEQTISEKLAPKELPSPAEVSKTEEQPPVSASSTEEKSRVSKPKLALREVETPEKKTLEPELSAPLKKIASPQKAPFNLFQEPQNPSLQKKTDEDPSPEEPLETLDSPQKKTNRIQKKSTARIKKKTQRLLKILFEDDPENTPVSDKNTLSDPIIEVVPIEKGNEGSLESSLTNLEKQLQELQQEEFREIDAEENDDEEEIQTVLPQDLQLGTDSSQENKTPPTLLEEKEPTSRLKKATQRLKKASQRLKRVFKSFDEHLDEEKKEAVDTRFISIHNKSKLFLPSPETKKSIDAVLAKLPEEDKVVNSSSPVPLKTTEEETEKSTSRFKKATQRLKKATEDLKGKTNRIVKSMVEYLEEEAEDSKETRYIPIDEVSPQILANEPPPEKISSRIKKMSERLKKKSQKLIKIFYEEPEEIKKEATENIEIGANYWYSLEDAQKLSHQKHKKNALPLASHGGDPEALPPSSFVGWNEFGMKNTGPASEKVLYKFAIGIASFFLFFWSIDMLPKERKTYTPSPTNTLISQVNSADTPKNKDPQNELISGSTNRENKGNFDEEELPLEDNPVFQIYFKNLSPEETLLKELLEKHQLTLLQADKLPALVQRTLDQKELILVLLEYQQKKDFFD
ncbi:MAG: PDZ domain-containing protein, partial [Planctomycetota bacterium]